MKILFVHQSFPGQYRHILRALAKTGEHQLYGMGIKKLAEDLPKGVVYFQYPIFRGNTPGLHQWLVDVDSKLIRAEACANAASKLKAQGLYPDLICAHPGWGEALFLKDIWENAPLLCYQEFFYNSKGFDSDFDQELQGELTWQDSARLLIKNTNPLLNLQISDWNVTPTEFQKSSFPKNWASKITALHDGIDTELASPNPKLESLNLPDGTKLTSKDSIITFVNRNIEPYRGCQTFIRSIPKILSENPSSRIIIVGNTEGVSYGKPADGNSWTDIFLAEIEGQYEKSRVHFTGTLSYNLFINLLQLSSCHVYLTYPFVLSWSLLEAMSIGCPIVASNTAPVTEVVRNGENGLLVDFFSQMELCSSIKLILTNNKISNYLGCNARNTIVNKYSLDKCVPLQIDLINNVANGQIFYSSP